MPRIHVTRSRHNARRYAIVATARLLVARRNTRHNRQGAKRFLSPALPRIS